MSKKTGKKYKPKYPNCYTNPVQIVLNKVKAFDPNLQVDLTLPVRIVTDAFLNSTANEDDWHTLALVSNVCLVLSENINQELEAEVKKCQAALLRVRDRYRSNKSLTLDADGRQRVLYIADLYDELIKVTVPDTLKNALNEVNRRMRNGNTLETGDL